MAKISYKLRDEDIKNWVKNGTRFGLLSDGNNLYLRYRPEDTYPRWIFRYSLQGNARTLGLGSLQHVSAAMARKEAARLLGLIATGRDVAQEKRERAQAAAMEAASQITVAQLAESYFERSVAPRLKHPGIVRAWIDKKINPAIGNLSASKVRPSHVDSLIQSVAREAPTVAPKLLSRLKAIFNHGVKLGYLSVNPASAFEASDAGPSAKVRERWLNRAELVSMLKAMREAPGWNEQNTLTVKLLLTLAVRKAELIESRIEEFDLAEGVWHLPSHRTKTKAAITIPLPTQAQASIRKLIHYGAGSEWLLPARKMQTRLKGHISLDTLNVGLEKSVFPLMKGVDPFTVHDFRRTARTHLEALDVDPFVAERCLNHKIGGLVGVYNKHDYLDKRRDALQRWADLLEDLDRPEAA
ncbi:tyrosine-type recombinase/integrase [Luteibacter sp. PPL201]|uniref:Tyrosine-type recombinase/integrase n=1 Tax=Luteibacter sahnii TaxID=3021977 RepID=A0ABT6BF47_9GAMM